MFSTLETSSIRKLRVAQKKEKWIHEFFEYSLWSPRNRQRRKNKKKGGREGGKRRGKNEIVRYAVSFIVRRSLKVTWQLLGRILRARGRPKVLVWWNGSRVIEISCSLPSRYDVRGGLIPTASLFLSLPFISFFISSSLSPFPSRYLFLQLFLLLILLERYADPFTCQVGGIRMRTGRARS